MEKMKKYILLWSLIVIAIAPKAQVKISSVLAKSALNSNVTIQVPLASVNGSPNSATSNVMGNISAQLSSSTVTAPVAANLLNPITSKFSHYTAFYASLITMDRYRNYYHNVPIAKYMPPFGEYYKQSGITSFNRFWPHYKYFMDGMPGYVPYVQEKPASIFVEVGVTKPVPLQVDPSNKSYYLWNTRFVRTFSLTY